MGTEVDGAHMTHDEMLDLCYLFILGGLDTVTSTLDCSIAYLAQHPSAATGARRRSVARPDRRRGAAAPADAGHAGPARRRAAARDARREDGARRSRRGDDRAADTDPTEFGDDADLSTCTAKRTGTWPSAAAPPLPRLAPGPPRTAHRLEELHRRIPDYQLADGADLEYSPGIREIKKLPLVFS